MSVPGVIAAAARSALAGLIDYAGLFPPAQLAMQPALDEYREARSGSLAWMLGRFIVPASALSDLLASAGSDESPIALSVIVNAGSDPRTWLASATSLCEQLARIRREQRAVAIEALEVPLPPLLSARETYEASVGQFAMLAEKYGLRDLPAYVEIPRDARYASELPAAMQALARFRLRGKVRCGGLTPEAYPSPAELAAFIITARDAGVAFKATAGLHHPVRHTNEAAGVTMHGFLNVLAASVAPDDAVEAVIAQTDPSAVLPDTFDAALARERFVGYGSCSFAEPVGDLIALGVLPKGA